MSSRSKNLFAALGLILLLGALPVALPAQAPAAQKPEILPLSQVKPGMKGHALTIFAGDTIEKMDLEVIGIMPNLIGPGQDIILVELKGARVEHTGVVGGMSGSPVFIDGKLVGALSLRFGSFAKVPLAGVTPIASILEVDPDLPAPSLPAGSTAAQSPQQAAAQPMTDAGWFAAVHSPDLPPAYPVNLEQAGEVAARAGLASGAFMTPIETPLVFSGFHPATLQRYAPQFAAMGMVAAAGGTADARPDDAQIQPGDMVAMVLVQGDLNLQSSCTVTMMIGDQVYVCGHPMLGYGAVQMPMARGRVLTTLSSSLASVKIVNAGSNIGTFTQDRLTAVSGRLGASPRMIPVELDFVSPGQNRKFRFEVMQHPKLTPLLVAISLFNGLTANTAYTDGVTFQLSGAIELKGYPAVSLENMFAPTDAPVADGTAVALTVQSIFARIFTNPYQKPDVERIRLRVETLPERRWSAVENAWASKNEVSPGEEIRLKVLLRPYRGSPQIHEIPIHIPAQVPKGMLRIVVSDSETLNRMTRFFTFGPQARLPGLGQLINLLNRERRNNRVYVTLLQPSPTLLMEDKELPNAPISQLHVLDRGRTPGTSLLLRESTAGEWSVPMDRVIVGQFVLTLIVK